jgi:hypothetical protein
MNARSFAQPLVTSEERRAYGDDLLSVVGRQAMEVMNPHLQQLREENERLSRQVYAQGARSIYDELDEHVPGWREINTSPQFLAWLNVPDVLSGAMRNALLRQAFAASDVGRVRAFFEGYLAEHPEARRGSTRSSRSQSSHSSASNASSQWTTSMVKAYFAKVRSGYFDTSDELRAEKARIEKNLEAAMRAGQIVRDSRD